MTYLGYSALVFQHQFDAVVIMKCTMVLGPTKCGTLLKKGGKLYVKIG